MNTENKSKSITRNEPIPPKRKKSELLTSDYRYANHKLWSSNRWSWEFLRRYKNFIDDCDKIKGKDIKNKESAIAQKYGIDTFKHYSDTSEPTPTFINKSIIHWEGDEAENGEISIKFNKGEMLILFYVNQTLHTKFELENQIKKATVRLKKYQQSLRTQENIKKNKEPFKNRRTTTSENYLRHLMIIDLRNEGNEWSQIAKIIFEEKIETDKRIRGGKFSNAEINQKYYKTLAASLDKPADYRKIASSTKEVNLARRVIENRKYKKRVERADAEAAAAKADADADAGASTSN